MKKCSKCKIDKSLTEFYKCKRSNDGYRYWCKVCFKSTNKSSRELNKKKLKIYRTNNKENITKNMSRWASENRDIRNTHHAKRRAAKLQRTVTWADKGKIKELYTKAKQLTIETGITHHVDHIIPLQGKTVSGLHVETNLQVITAYENLSKHNNFENNT